MRTLSDIEIAVYPRLHLGLLSMHADAPRMNGGIGFAIDGPQATVIGKPAASVTVEDHRRWPMGAAELDQLRAALTIFADRLCMRGGVSIQLEGEMRTHVGMGSATAIRLAALEAFALANGREADRAVLVASSGRGGTSGIGVNSYFDGGLVCDLGRKSGGPFAPSSQVRTAPLALALPSVRMPDWPILLCLPKRLQSKTQGDEIAFFARTTPLPAYASYKASYVALFELYAAAAEVDFAAFCRGVERMQLSSWKGAERAEYGVALATISEGLLDAGARCVGMSSLGPLLFCLADAGDVARLSQVAQSLDCEVREVRPVNRGRVLRSLNA
ncbi:beta-ribofuranosylaminobenzene 5'-phosphate synthase family protein [Sphingomonas sp. PP-CE-1G-424]|uniref:beta-ribofuranosylaminobenzene 5'-phosphate synthase family protein n=1 Tax=Sphingomonas sp. PP-CE-1G-424 TaxID=2135658 RepID=UPI00243701D0|nr:beta-ribofuranosylaminobenzene 5'-phosphate synthase family protein [Sphingomonas sp. PP-CE-1G-424]